MQTYRENMSDSSRVEQRGRRIAGVSLLGIGLLVFAAQYIKISWIEMLFLFAIGLILVAWAIAVRSPGLLLAGGIQSGLGLGAALSQGPLAHLDGDAEGAIFLLCFALGWVSISLLARLVQPEPLRWPLIPAAVLGILGIALLSGGQPLALITQVLGLAETGWPVALVVVGLFLIVRRKH